MGLWMRACPRMKLKGETMDKIFDWFSAGNVMAFGIFAISLFIYVFYVRIRQDEISAVKIPPDMIVYTAILPSVFMAVGDSKGWQILLTFALMVLPSYVGQVMFLYPRLKRDKDKIDLLEAQIRELKDEIKYIKETR
jgi:hypothetical protein